MGATLITLVLLLLQIGVVNICRKVHMAWAFTFVPSALCLAALTDVEPSDVDGMLHFSSGVYLLPIGLIVSDCLFGQPSYWLVAEFVLHGEEHTTFCYGTIFWCCCCACCLCVLVAMVARFIMRALMLSNVSWTAGWMRLCLR